MRRHLTLTLVAFATIAGSLPGQTYERRATLSESGVSGGQGKCTIEVVVDGTTDVEIRGDRGVLRTVAGAAPQWRRFECTGAVPYNPTDFKFTGVDGRGTQQLARDPRTDGIAVVRITDQQGGSHGYTFDLTWSGGSTYSSQNGNDSIFGNSGNSGRTGRRISTDEAIRVCQDAVRQEAGQRFGTTPIEFRKTSLTDNPGRRDIVAGTFVTQDATNVNGNNGRRNRNNGRQNAHQFSCSMNFNNGQLQTVQIDQQQSAASSIPLSGDRGPAYNTQAMRACEQAVQDRTRRDGYQRTTFGQMNSDSSNRIVGAVTADKSNVSDSFNFACTFNGDSGTVRSVELNRR